MNSLRTKTHAVNKKWVLYLLIEITLRTIRERNSMKLHNTLRFLSPVSAGAVSLLVFACFPNNSTEEDPCLENPECQVSNPIEGLSSAVLTSSSSDLSSPILSSGSNLSSGEVVSSAIEVSSADAAANFQSLLTEQQFNSMFPKRDQFYTYQGLVDAVQAVAGVKIKLERRVGLNYDAPQVSRWDGSQWVVMYAHVDFNQSWNLSKPITSEEVDFGEFLRVGTQDQIKEELMAFLAQASHETTGRAPSDPMNGGLYWNEELSFQNGGIGYTSSNDPNFQPVSGQSYHGRGPFQISYPYNYGKFTYEVFGNSEGLTNPAMVLRDSKTAFMAGIWFWMRPQIPKPSMHKVILGLASDDQGVNGASSRFGWTTNIINGGLECGRPGNAASVDRQNYFKAYMQQAGLTPESNLSCAQMSSY